MIYYDNTSERDQTRITSSSIVDGSLGWFVRVLQVLTPGTSVDLWSVHQVVAVFILSQLSTLGRFLCLAETSVNLVQIKTKCRL